MAKIGQKTGIQLEFVEFGGYFLVLLRREGPLDKVKENIVLLIYMVSDKRREATRKDDKLPALLRVQGVFKTLDERTLLIVFEQHLPQRPLLIPGGAHQFRKQGALFLCLMVVVGKDSEEVEKGFHIPGFHLFAIGDFPGHVIEDVEAPENDFVILH